MAKRWVATDFGGLDVLAFVDAEVPDPGPGEVTRHERVVSGFRGAGQRVSVAEAVAIEAPESAMRVTGVAAAPCAWSARAASFDGLSVTSAAPVRSIVVVARATTREDSPSFAAGATRICAVTVTVVPAGPVTMATASRAENRLAASVIRSGRPAGASRVASARAAFPSAAAWALAAVVAAASDAAFAAVSASLSPWSDVIFASAVPSRD